MEGGTETPELPIALRRTRRNLSQSRASSSSPAAAPKQTPCASPKRPSRETLALQTPNSRKRHVRFSDPGPQSAGKECQPSTTGLTPMIRRTSLSSSRTQRRRSTPACLFPSNGSGIPSLDSQGSPFSGEVHFLPLRQVLDGRVKRRIRRNGLSEEMNTILTERRRRAEKAKAEMERLKAELAEKDEEIERLHDETVVLDTERVWDLEQQVASLKRELASRAAVQEVPSSPPVEWARAAQTPPQSDNSMEYDIDDVGTEFSESARAELACSTPTRRMRAASFPTPPSTSPEPQPSETPCRRLPTPRSSMGTQASLPDPEKQQLEQQLEVLHLEVAKLTTALESYSALASRLSDKLTPALLPTTPSPESSSSSSEEAAPNPHPLEAQLTTILQTLSDRTAALTTLDTTLQSLGFPGTDAFEVLTSLTTTLRTARLELEYTTPGESTLPLTGAGAQVLTQLLTHLRTLTHQNRDLHDALDESHALTTSLRSQLRARVAATDELAAQLADAEREAREREAEHAAAVARLQGELAAQLAQTDALRIELDTLSAAHAEEVAGLVGDVAARDGRVGELEAEVLRVGGGGWKVPKGLVRGLKTGE
ncbi:hypothetical protein CHGG_09857 [Chaetomium globosum CBS 148.51]|uniref:Uncharacterized protein n=1 Tax=Chaetomium globosum (strain ATCC 6205 / CBS 148.51 / DSM 1962 / NBRC 6347 / NRRL 1970) TaxID=306901 RepID=Q2GQ97_CHAGB|nr:uncharacterized protein CHGG_09857 [Chaetomium globosum CBS 148.51]EAQ83453.1 hypothetical protein CHGG_09857 [Chaetomium globosum CBS 148.51]